MSNAWIAVVMVASICVLTGCENKEEPVPEKPIVQSINQQFAIAQPVADDGLANNLFRSGDMWFGGQPTREGLVWLRDQGVTTIVNLRTDSEMDSRVGFDESAVAEELGFTYIHVPVTPDSFSKADVERYAAAVDAADKSGVFLHCASSGRVGAMWAAYLYGEHDVDEATALKHGASTGLRGGSMERIAKRVMGEYAAD